MTTGVLLQKIVGAKSLAEFTHIFIDEVGILHLEGLFNPLMTPDVTVHHSVVMGVWNGLRSWARLIHGVSTCRPRPISDPGRPIT